MAFKKAPPPTEVTDSPEKLFLELPRRKFPDVLPHQKELMRSYSSTAMKASDVALQLPTGSGKTLVGLLIGEWRRRRNQEKIVYLCPTRQLVNQVVEHGARQGFALREREIIEGLANKTTFERAQKLLGELLGFIVGKVESDGSPDPWWISGDICIVFEDHAGGEGITILGATKARQASSHPALMKANVEECRDPNVQILPVLVTPVTKANAGALPHLDGVALWRLADFREWANRAIAVVRDIRKTFSEPGDLAWRAQAAVAFSQQGLDALGLYEMLKKMPAKDALGSE